MLQPMFKCDLCHKVDPAVPPEQPGLVCSIPEGWFRASVQLGPNRSFSGDLCDHCLRTLRMRIKHYETGVRDNSGSWKHDPFDDPPAVTDTQPEGGGS